MIKNINAEIQIHIIIINLTIDKIATIEMTK